MKKGSLQNNQYWQFTIPISRFVSYNQMVPKLAPILWNFGSFTKKDNNFGPNCRLLLLPLRPEFESVFQLDLFCFWPTTRWAKQELAMFFSAKTRLQNTKTQGISACGQHKTHFLFSWTLSICKSVDFPRWKVVVETILDERRFLVFRGMSLPVFVVLVTALREGNLQQFDTKWAPYQL